MHWVRHPAPLSRHQAVIKHQNVREIQDKAVCNIGRRYFNNCSLDLRAEIYILQLDVSLKGFSLTNPTIYIFLYGNHSLYCQNMQFFRFPTKLFLHGQKTAIIINVDIVN